MSHPTTREQTHMSNRLNLLAPEVLENPYPFFAELRKRPLCQVDPGGLWAVSRYEDALHVFKNPQLFASEAFKRALQPPWVGQNPTAQSILVMDPPQHGRMRALVSRGFTPAAIAELEPMIRAKAESLTARLLEQRGGDFISTFAVPLPAAVIGHLLGLDESLTARFKEWSDAQGAISAIAPDDLQSQQWVLRCMREMRGYLEQVLEQRRRQPGSDMVSTLLQAQVEGKALSELELLSFLFLLLVAGLETTANLLGSATLWLTQHPEMLQRLRAEPALISAFVEEALRYDSPGQVAFRMTTQEVELGGVRLPPHSVLMLLLGSFCRDEQYVPEPDRFLLERPLQSMPFGHGIHFCLGAPLARLEARVALEVLLPRIRQLSRSPGPLEYNPSIQLRGLKRLPVEVLPA